mmetsp:Transcript_15428/g.13158  ORF Transcript_15428/g.13158 Transcript_15428/m.13158 type:complete len:136 (-) Transcript_15428:2294-2701(-)
MGNKVSIKEEFAKFSETNSPDELKKGLSSLTAMKIDDDNFRLSIFPNDIRKFIDAKPDLFKVAVEQCVNNVFSAAAGDQPMTDNQAVVLNNYLNFLIRFIPVVHEEKYNNLAKEIFWTKVQLPGSFTESIKDKNS